MSYQESNIPWPSGTYPKKAKLAQHLKIHYIMHYLTKFYMHFQLKNIQENRNLWIHSKYIYLSPKVGLFLNEKTVTISLLRLGESTISHHIYHYSSYNTQSIKTR